jgi:membrane-associated phospholipid phosphatase
MVSEWMHTLYGAIRVERLSPPVASRLMAYASTALYAGLASARPDMAPVTGVLNGLKELPQPEMGPRYDGTFAAVAAERVVLDSLMRDALPTTRAAIARLADSLDKARGKMSISESTVRRSAFLGKEIGLAIVAWSRTDGFDSTRKMPPFKPPTGLAYWVNDAPANTYATQNLSGASEFVALNNPANAMQPGATSDRGLILSRPKVANPTLPAVNMAGMSEPYWGQIRPFALRTWNECPVPPPPPYAVDTTSVLYRDANVVRTTRGTLTPEQRTIAFYWADNAGESGTPVGHWTSIASQMVSEKHLSAEDAARVMVLTSAAEADAFIASWGYKYQYSLIRPRTYIRRVVDSTWEPLIPTPPFPEYPSGHSTVSAAAAAVLTNIIGDVPFADSTGLSIGNAVRLFPSFRAAAEEAGVSRIYGGIHFPYGNTSGQALGRCIGERAIERFRSANGVKP